MIRLAARGIAAVLLELATVAIVLAVAALLGSAYLISRFVGIEPKFSSRTALAMKVGRNALAYGMSKRPLPEPVTDTTD